jgi:hypothetical protein
MSMMRIRELEEKKIFRAWHQTVGTEGCNGDGIGGIDGGIDGDL